MLERAAQSCQASFVDFLIACSFPPLFWRHIRPGRQMPKARGDALEVLAQRRPLNLRLVERENLRHVSGFSDTLADLPETGLTGNRY